MAIKADKMATPSLSSTSTLSKELRRMLMIGTLTLFTTIVALTYLMPMIYSVTAAVKERQTEADAPWWPATPLTFAYQGEDVSVYTVPIDGVERQLALVKKGRTSSQFVDPLDSSNTLIEWQGAWRTLDRIWSFSPRWDNFSEAFNTLNFVQLFVNTLIIGLVGTVGALVSAIFVAYGFSRFRIPGKTILFTILMATIILPPQVTLIPTYTAFAKLGWVGTFLPLLVPHFFANAYNVFILRQFFMGIPREMDEAAMIDGASPFRTLISVIVPQALPAVTSVALFHFFFSWNDYFNPLIYLAGAQNLWTISIGLGKFSALYNQQPHLTQASALLAIAVPLVIFFFSQKVFMRGVVVTGVEK